MNQWTFDDDLRHKQDIAGKYIVDKHFVTVYGQAKWQVRCLVQLPDVNPTDDGRRWAMRSVPTTPICQETAVYFLVVETVKKYTTVSL